LPFLYVVKQPQNETIEQKRKRLASALKEHLAKIMLHRQEAEEQERIKREMASKKHGKGPGRSKSVIPTRVSNLKNE
jgi:hypothetical protein